MKTSRSYQGYDSTMMTKVVPRQLPKKPRLKLVKANTKIEAKKNKVTPLQPPKEPPTRPKARLKFSYKEELDVPFVLSK